MSITIKDFEELAREYHNVDEFMAEVRKIKTVPAEVSQLFWDQYQVDNDIRKSCINFIKTVLEKDSELNLVSGHTATEEQIDQVFPPFSDKRRELRKRWNKHCREVEHYNWDKWLQHYTEMELAPDLPF